jgi:hypothetical protein
MVCAKRIDKMKTFYVLAALIPSLSAFAGQIWYFDQRQASIKINALQYQQTSDSANHDRHWLGIDFKDDPIVGDLSELGTVSGYERLSLTFRKPVLPAIAEEYISAARAWKRSGIEAQLRFLGTLPTEQEAEILKPLCALGIRIRFIATVLPTESEAKNLLGLRDCAEVQFAIGRYFKQDDLTDVRRVLGLPLGVATDYFPTYTHVDLMNTLDSPISVFVTNALPLPENIEPFNQLKRLTRLTLDLTYTPLAENYAAIERLSSERRSELLSLEWRNVQPSQAEIDAWKRLHPASIFLANPVDANTEARLRTLPSEVIFTR